MSKSGSFRWSRVLCGRGRLWGGFGISPVHAAGGAPGGEDLRLAAVFVAHAGVELHDGGAPLAQQLARGGGVFHAGDAVVGLAVGGSVEGGEVGLQIGDEVGGQFVGGEAGDEGGIPPHESEHTPCVGDEAALGAVSGQGVGGGEAGLWRAADLDGAGGAGDVLQVLAQGIFQLFFGEGAATGLAADPAIRQRLQGGGDAGEVGDGSAPG